jgi:hypothetical protein
MMKNAEERKIRIENLISFAQFKVALIEIEANMVAFRAIEL